MVQAIVPSVSWSRLGFWGAMERDDIGDGAQTQPLAGSGLGCFVEVVAQYLAACLVQDEGFRQHLSLGVLCGCGCHRF